jgi:p-aminobenzoyl-glutamate transporter AbgT
VIFFILSGLVIVLSHLFCLGTSVNYEVVNPETHRVEHATATVNSLLSGEGICLMLTSMVRNFMNFGPVGIILVVMLGVGLAEQAGLMTVDHVPAKRADLSQNFCLVGCSGVTPASETGGLGVSRSLLRSRFGQSAKKFGIVRSI